MINVLKPGFYTTLQDLGRFGFQKYGVPVSGVMDYYSAKLANAIMNNDENDALLEITMTGPTLQFTCETEVCISGADISPKLNNASIQLNTLVQIQDGDILSFGKPIRGVRCYMAVSGGFKTEEKMGSRSMYKGITDTFSVANGDVLEIVQNPKKLGNKKFLIKSEESHFESREIEVYEGPEFNQLSSYQKKLLFSQSFTVSKNNNRMAYQLEETFSNNLKSIITSLVLPGTVQLTPSGKLIILMRDCQTTGGYPRILQLAESDINKLSQKFTREVIQFRLLGN
jgi:biotin-dependent carboxylase-like uncharacterized protein